MTNTLAKDQDIVSIRCCIILKCRRDDGLTDNLVETYSISDIEIDVKNILMMNNEEGIPTQVIEDCQELRESIRLF